MDERETSCTIFEPRCSICNIMYVILIGTSVIKKKKRRKNRSFRKVNIEKIYEPANVASRIFKRRMNNELQRLNIFELINGKILELVGHV